MKYCIIGITWLSLWTVHAQNITNNIPKTKRNLSRDVQSYGESGLILPYNDNPKVYFEPKQVNTYQVRPLALVDLGQPVKVIEPKVAAQQVLYEFQQTPTDAVSNVHVKQLFEQDLKPPPQNNPPNLVTSESVAPAVHHGQFLQNPSYQTFNHKQHPLYNVQPTFFEPKKYVYGKIIVDSTSPHQPNFHHHHGNPNVFYSNQPFLPQGSHGKPILNYVNHFPRNNVVIPTTESPHIIQQNKFKPPPKSQYQPIDKPARGKLEQNPKQKKVEKPVAENEEAEEEEHEERPNYREEEEDREEYESPFDKYFEDEESTEYGHHENTEDDDEVEEDNKRGSSKYITKREKHPKKYKTTKSYYSKYTSSPEERYFKNDGKKHKSYKNKNYKKSKSPPHELEGKYSEHIPITHKKKILKEKWYVSKSLADKERYDHES